MTENSYLRATFNQSAADYDAIRPKYPEPLFDDVIALSDIPHGGQILEIGCGTGQATLPLARRGYAMVCVDIGADLLAIAAQNLRAYPNVQFEQAAFEDWPLQAGAFDLVFAATAFHWIPREVGYPKAALALKPGGALAIFANTHPRPYSGFFEEVQPIYEKHMPELREPRTVESAMQAQLESIEASGLFRTVTARTYPWTVTYSASAYVQLLNTYSDHLALDAARRQALYQEIGDLIEKRYGGVVERPYLTELYVAKKANSWDEQVERLK